MSSKEQEVFEASTHGQKHVNTQFNLTMISVGGFVVFLAIVLIIRYWSGTKLTTK